MGYDAILVPRNRDENKLYEIDYLDSTFSRKFSMFQSRFFDGCEMEQVEEILDIDLTIYRKFATNYNPDIGELEYRLYLAKEANDFDKIKFFEEKIEIVKKDWEKNYYMVTEGWTTIYEFIQVTKAFIKKINLNPNYGEKIKIAQGWKYPWGDFFSTSQISNKNTERLHLDLEHLVNLLEIYKKHKIEYVGFIAY